ncbi:MAG: guanylate kinase [Alphaproteobacteria bacterium]|nr:guanylate kinase [Alphaproteobacteria bacterium]
MTKDAKLLSKILVLTAPSGTGKTTIADMLTKDPDFAFSVSATSRRRRKGEVKGKAYLFMTKEEFKEKIKNREFLEYSMTNGNYYGTLKSHLRQLLAKAKYVICTMDYNGLEPMRKAFPGRVVSIFMRPPSKAELEERLKKRGSSDRDIKLRMATYDDFLSHAHRYDYVIVNSDLLRTAVNIKDILKNAG